jgi:hypothetical protein
VRQERAETGKPRQPSLVSCLWRGGGEKRGGSTGAEAVLTSSCHRSRAHQLLPRLLSAAPACHKDKQCLTKGRGGSCEVLLFSLLESIVEVLLFSLLAGRCEVLHFSLLESSFESMNQCQGMCRGRAEARAAVRAHARGGVKQSATMRRRTRAPLQRCMSGHVT